MHPPSVLHVISGIDARGGGPVQALLGLTEAQRARGQEVTVISSFRAGDDLSLRDRFGAFGVRVMTVGPGRTSLQRHPDLRPALLDALSSAEVAHIHAVWEEIHALAAGACRRAKIPYIFRPCGMLDPWCLAQGRLKKKLYLELRMRRHLNGAAAMHFTSETERDLVRPLGLRPPAVVEANGVVFSEFETPRDPGAFRRLHPMIGERPLILFMSRVHPKKGLDLLIPAVARMRDRSPVLVIAGPGDEAYVNDVRGWIESNGIADRALMVGMVRGETRIAMLRDADLFTLPSYQENFGVAVVEALAGGAPVVISDQVNIHREITEAGVGEAVPTEVDALAAALDRWIADPARRAAAAERAQSFVRERYDWHRIAERWEARYRRVRDGLSPE